MKVELTNPVNQMLDAWLGNVGTLCWAQDQSETLLSSMIEQGQLARADGQRLAGRMAEQAKANQAELQKFIHNSVALSVEGLQKVHQAQLATMQVRLDEMAGMVESLNTQLQKPTS